MLNQNVYVGGVSGDTSPIIWPYDGRSISRNVANINKLVQNKTKPFFQNILQHQLLENLTNTDVCHFVNMRKDENIEFILVNPERHKNTSVFTFRNLVNQLKLHVG